MNWYVLLLNKYLDTKMNIPKACITAYLMFCVQRHNDFDYGIYWQIYLKPNNIDIFVQQEIEKKIIYLLDFIMKVIILNR